jgi:hypothetical protein
MRKENILSSQWDLVDLFRGIITLEHTQSDEMLSASINDTLMELFKRLS